MLETMKIAITGKGGTGKTTIAGVLAHCFKDDGYGVLAVDADPDANLASALGIPADKASSIVPIARRRELIKERTGAEPDQFGQMFRMNPAVSDIPEDYSLDFRGIKLLVMGAIQKGGKGCACPENVLLQSLLSEIMLNRDEVVIVDMEAGIEHLGRATCRAVDRMLVVVEPGSRSVATARTIIRLAEEIGIGSFGIVGNKILNEDQAAWLSARFPSTRLTGLIPYSKTILDADLKQVPLIDTLDESLKAEFKRLYQAIKQGELPCPSAHAAWQPLSAVFRMPTPGPHVTLSSRASRTSPRGHSCPELTSGKEWRSSIARACPGLCLKRQSSACTSIRART
jgi:CO dehydrogenase maturation factor